MFTYTYYLLNIIVYDSSITSFKSISINSIIILTFFQPNYCWVGIDTAALV